MSTEKPITSEKNSTLHLRNKHRERYDFKALTECCPELIPYVILNKTGLETIDFFNPDAVKYLNTALLKHHYNIEYWDIPSGYLCPGIPGRADYLHYMGDLLGNKNAGNIPKGSKIKCLDIGIGANSVYPIIGITEYGWSFTGSEIDLVALENVRKILDKNPILKANAELRIQQNPLDIFNGIILPGEFYDLSICNPPFHATAEVAQQGTLRKLKHLSKNKPTEATLNFGGNSTELICEGGEVRFIGDMITQSKDYSASCFWFSTLVSKKTHLRLFQPMLKEVKAAEVKTLPMQLGNKSSTILAWTFLSQKDQKQRKQDHWL